MSMVDRAVFPDGGGRGRQSGPAPGWVSQALCGRRPRDWSPSAGAVCAQGTNSAHPFCLRHPDRFDDALFAPILCLPQSGAESRRGCMNRHAGSYVDSTPFADVAAKYQYDEIPRGSTY